MRRRRSASTRPPRGVVTRNQCTSSAPDPNEAYRWFASAAELGHRGARQRILATATAAPPQQTERQHIALEAQKARYAALTGLRISRVTEAVLAPEV